MSYVLRLMSYVLRLLYPQSQEKSKKQAPKQGQKLDRER